MRVLYGRREKEKEFFPLSPFVLHSLFPTSVYGEGGCHMNISVRKKTLVAPERKEIPLDAPSCEGEPGWIPLTL